MHYFIRIYNDLQNRILPFSHKQQTASIHMKHWDVLIFRKWSYWCSKFSDKYFLRNIFNL